MHMSYGNTAFPTRRTENPLEQEPHRAEATPGAGISGLHTNLGSVASV